MHRMMIALAAPLALLALPAQAQPEPGEDAAQAELGQLAAMMSEMFTAEPLTTEQAARLPVTQQLVRQVMPDGTYARMMDETLASMLAPLTSLMPETMPAAVLAQVLGRPVAAVEGLDPSQQAKIARIIDPAYADRIDASMDYMMAEMTGILSSMEPALREGLAKAYAVRFNEQQLADIAAFFATDTGAYYATESMLVFADPQVMQSTMQAMPLVFEKMPAILEGTESAMAGLPPARDFADLSDAERRTIADALGVTVATLEESMADAASVRETVAQ